MAARPRRDLRLTVVERIPRNAADRRSVTTHDPDAGTCFRVPEADRTVPARGCLFDGQVSYREPYPEVGAARTRAPSSCVHARSQIALSCAWKDWRAAPAGKTSMAVRLEVKLFERVKKGSYQRAIDPLRHQSD